MLESALPAAVEVTVLTDLIQHHRASVRDLNFEAGARGGAVFW